MSFHSKHYACCLRVNCSSDRTNKGGGAECESCIVLASLGSGLMMRDFISNLFFRSALKPRNELFREKE